jgi:hypothetical protein
MEITSYRGSSGPTGRITLRTNTRHMRLKTNPRRSHAPSPQNEQEQRSIEALLLF